MVHQRNYHKGWEGLRNFANQNPMIEKSSNLLLTFVSSSNSQRPSRARDRYSVRCNTCYRVTVTCHVSRVTGVSPAPLLASHHTVIISDLSNHTPDTNTNTPRAVSEFTSKQETLTALVVIIVAAKLQHERYEKYLPSKKICHSLF